jgi:hypothetical protein
MQAFPFRRLVASADASCQCLRREETMNDLSGRVALVTGGARGLGAAAAKALAAKAAAAAKSRA